MEPKAHKHVTFNSGAQRSDRSGKGRYDLISPHGLKRLAIQYEEGSKHHEDARNWELGFPISRALCSALGHIMDHLAGNCSEDHLAAGVWQLFAAMHFEELIEQGKLPVELNDVPFDANTLPPDAGTTRMKFYITRETITHMHFNVIVSDGSAGELCMPKDEFQYLIGALGTVGLVEVKYPPADDLRRIADWERFDVIAKVDLPEGAEVWTDVATHDAIVQGQMRGEIVNIAGKFILQERGKDDS